MARAISYTAVGLLLAVGVIAGAWFSAGQTGSTRIERWVAEYLRGVVNRHINAELTFDELDYRAPRGLTISNLALRADGTMLLSIQSATLELAEVPRPGRPIIIDRIELDTPRFRFVRSAAGGFVGWNGLVRADVQTDYDNVEPGYRVSDFLRLRRATITDAGLVYDAADGQPPMVLTGFSLALDTPPAETPGRHDLSGAFTWQDALRLSLAAQLDLDAAQLDIASLTFAGHLRPAQYALFPPPLQKLLNTHRLEAQLAGRLAGRLPLRHPDAAELELSATLTEACLTIKDVRPSIDRAELHVGLHRQQVDFGLQLEMMDGNASASGTLDLDDDLTLEANLTASEIELARLVELKSTSQPSIAGKLSGKCLASAELSDLPDSLRGDGTFELRDAHLLRLPLVSGLTRFVHKGKFPAWQRTGRAQAEFTLTPGYVDLRRLQLVTRLIAADGTGKLLYDGTINLVVRAGALERVATAMGALGDVLKKAAGKLVAYHVTGSIGKPKIKVAPLGIGAKSKKP